MPEKIAQRVLLVAWPGADWSTVSRLLDAGLLPNVEKLTEDGVVARTPGLFPEIEPLVYTSIATGVTADRHGILSAQERDPRTGKLRPPVSTSRKTKALWNILSEAGMRSLVVNWPAQFPAEAIDGVSATDDLFTVNGLHPAGEAPPESVFPSNLGRTLAALCVHPSGLCDEDLAPFLPRPAGRDQCEDGDADTLAQGLARAMSAHAVMAWLMENERWELAATCCGFIQAAACVPRALDEAYRLADTMLGRSMALAGDDAAILLVSGNGIHSPGRRGASIERVLPWYSTGGFCCISGAGAKRDRLLHGASLLDIAPTVLAILGLPVARDLQGRPLLQAFLDPPMPAFVSTWESQETARDTALDHSGEAAAGRERALNCAAVYLDTARPQQAIPLLRDLLRENPADETCGMALGYAYILAAEWGQLRELFAELPESVQTVPLANAMRAMLSVVGGNVSEALALLKQAERAAGDFPMFAYEIGCVYLRLRKWRRAERAFRAAAERNPEFWLAREARALALTGMGRQRQAAALLRGSIHIHFAGSGSHYLLGTTLTDLADHAGWRRAFHNPLALARVGR